MATKRGSEPNPEGSTLQRRSSILSLSKQQALSERAVDTYQKVQPYLVQAYALFQLVLPYLFMLGALLHNLWQFLKPYHPEEFAPALLGLMMAFFGGTYFTTFAAIEAYRVCGWDKTIDCIKRMVADFKVVYKAHLEDNERDDDGNGIRDVDEMSPRDLALRKLNLVLTTVDPMELADAAHGITVGFAGVIASLQVQFAQTITIGVTLGDIARKASEPILGPLFYTVFPKPYHKWVPVVIIYGSKVFGVSLAWTVQRVISSFYSAVRGAELFVRGTSAYLERNGIQVPVEQDSYFLAGAAVLVAFLGFVTQLFLGFSLPFPLNIIFFPVTVVEWFLMYFVAIK